MCIDDNIYDEYGFSIIFNTRPKHCLRICLHRRLALARVQGHLQVRGGGVAEHQEVNLEYSQLILSLSYIIDYLVHLVQLQHFHPGQLGEVGVGKLLRGPVKPLTVGVSSHYTLTASLKVMKIFSHPQTRNQSQVVQNDKGGLTTRFDPPPNGPRELKLHRSSTNVCSKTKMFLKIFFDIRFRSEGA